MLGEVKGIVVGDFEEASDSLHQLIHHLVLSRVKTAGPQLGKKGQVRSEQAEIAITTSFLRQTVSICALKGQSSTLLGILEVLGEGTDIAVRRRNAALQLVRRWSNVSRAYALSTRQGHDIMRRRKCMIN